MRNPERAGLMSKFREATVKDREGNVLGKSCWLFCPGCEAYHKVYVGGPDVSPIWTYNGNPNCPTISPSLLVNGHDPATLCHSFIKDGQIRFLNDCHHKLKGQTVELPDCPGLDDLHTEVKR